MRHAALALVLWLPVASSAVALPLHPRRAGPVLARLGAAPPADASPERSRGDGPLTPQEKDRRDAVVEALLDAEAHANEHPETAVAVLQRALRGMHDVAPLVAEDDYAQTARTYAQLALARTHLVLEQPQPARDAIDEALRGARGRPLPAAMFGPALEALHDERRAALAEIPSASLVVRCRVPCRVLVDERPLDAEGPALPAGSHRVWVEAVTAGLPVLRRTLELGPGEAVELPYEVEAPGPEPTTSAPEPARTDEPLASPRRILPRWASVLGLGVGVGMAGAGGALVAVDHRCPNLDDPRTTPCLRILNTDAAGFTLVGVGGAVAIAAAVILAIDEARAKRARN